MVAQVARRSAIWVSPAGQRIGRVDSSGQGKSTLLSLLLCLYAMNAGARGAAV